MTFTVALQLPSAQDRGHAARRRTRRSAIAGAKLPASKIGAPRGISLSSSGRLTSALRSLISASSSLVVPCR
jgi:hypothetical protein